MRRDRSSGPRDRRPLALQTLVENAIKYGVSREAGAGVLSLSADQHARAKKNPFYDKNEAAHEGTRPPEAAILPAAI